MRISDWSSDVCSSDLDAQEDWDLRQKWVQAQIGKLWQRRGLYPGLLTVMDLLDAEASIKNAKWYCDRREEKKAYELFFDALDGGKDCPELELTGLVAKRVSRSWQLLEDDVRAFLKAIADRKSVVWGKSVSVGVDL